jgi:adenylate cyclase
VLSLVITVGLALVLGSRLSQPILRLVGGMNQVKAGDLSVTLQPSTKDEIGLLTSTFNDMIGNLRERLQLMKYVGSHTLEMIKDRDGGDVPLGGSRHELAVLFTDIRGFTSFSEKRDPEDVISMLNRYLGFQAQIVERWQGSVDKFVGDEMMALFTGDNALDQAVGCAQEIMRRVELEHATDPAPIHIGVGINCGPAILGNMGAQNRMDYTAIGATVNLGARLVSSAAPGQILIPADLVERLTVPVRVCRREAMTFKNLSQPIEVAQIDFDEEETPHA